MEMINTAYIVDIARTPVGKFGGTLSSIRPDDLAAHIIKSLLDKSFYDEYRDEYSGSVKDADYYVHREVIHRK